MKVVNKVFLILFSLHRVISGASLIARGLNSASISPPDICPLGEPLRSSQGSVVVCNCPPHPFCPMLYYCKIALHGKPGICCPDFGADNRHLIKPEDSRLPVVKEYGPSSRPSCATASCEIPGKTAARREKESEKNAGVISPPSRQPIPSKKQENFSSNLRDPKTICKPVSPLDIPPLPSPKCRYQHVEPDAFGCNLPPRVVCPKSRDCPPFSISVIPPDCVLGHEKYDRNGCPVMPDLICGNRLTGKVSQPKVIPQAPASKPKDTKRVIKKITQPMNMRAAIITTTNAPSPPPCPVYLLPPTLSPDCVVAPPKRDARGCHLPPEIVCEKRPTSYTESADKMQDPAPQDLLQEDMTKPEEKKCPKVKTPFVQPGCKLLDPKYDNKGCMLMREIVCDTTIVSKKSCPVLRLPKMDPTCKFGPDRNDSNGCPMVPEIICPTTVDFELDTAEPATETPSVLEKKEPRVMSHCPYVPPPYLPPGCTYGVAKYDHHGCSLAPDVICKHEGDEKTHIVDVPPLRQAAPDDHLQLLTPPRPNFPATEMPPITYKREFKDMLSPEFYHTVNSNVSPDPAAFRRSIAVATVTAGRFYGCRLHADCFHLREPREWCDTGSPQSDAQWTDKSCHCSEDTVVPACIVERSNRGLLEWTFCADYSQCALKD